ncbi:MAG: hypothetical protein ACI857_003241 [Arenicella sp.]
MTALTPMIQLLCGSRFVKKKQSKRKSLLNTMVGLL